MAYEILNENTVIKYLRTIDNINEYLGEGELEISEIGDGNLNFVFIVKSKSDNSKALIVKQAVPYLRCVGEAFPLSRERMNYEIRAMQQASVYTQNCIPKIYYASEEMSVVVMQYLHEHIIMRKGLIAQTYYPNFAEQISTYLAQNLFKTSSLYLDSTSKRELIGRFNTNTQLCKLTEDFVFTFAFMENETNDEYAKGNILAKNLFEDMEFKKAVLGLKYKFMTQNDALLHGDLHTGSIMINENETFVIDPEFAFFGPFGFDIGALIGNLIMSYVSHVVLNSPLAYQEYILQTIKAIMIQFEEKFLKLWNEQNESALLTQGFINDVELLEFKSKFMLDIFQQTLGFAGCKMARRMFGIAGVEDIRAIEDTNIRDKAIAMTLNIATTFVKEYQKIENIEEVITIIKKELE